jgi:hypothetical protein
MKSWRRERNWILTFSKIAIAAANPLIAGLRWGQMGLQCPTEAQGGGGRFQLGQSPAPSRGIFGGYARKSHSPNPLVPLYPGATSMGTCGPVRSCCLLRRMQDQPVFRSKSILHGRPGLADFHHHLGFNLSESVKHGGNLNCIQPPC